MIATWVLDKLEAAKDEPVALVRDGLRLLSENDGAVHRFAEANGFTVIMAATNLVFRELLEKSKDSRKNAKLLLIDRAPARRRRQTTTTKAPPPFYPDLLRKLTQTAVIEVSLRQFLIERTGDPNWPVEADDPRYARLMGASLDAVLKAHAGLRIADSQRFTDQDFKTIVAYAVLGVPEAAFKMPDAQTYWRIGFFSREGLEELSSLAPDVAVSVRNNLHKAPPPFRHFADSPPELVVRAFYLAAILSQHCEHWKLLLAQIDPDLQPFSDMDVKTIQESAPALARLEPRKADTDLSEAEAGLSKEAIHTVLMEQIRIMDGGRFAQVLADEQYSTLVRCLALAAALDDILSDSPATEAHKHLKLILSGNGTSEKAPFVEQRDSKSWDNLKTAYRLASSLLEIRGNLDKAVKTVGIMQSAEISFGWFKKIWNEQRLNRLEYYLSDLERLIGVAEWLPRPDSGLPPAFLGAKLRIQDRLKRLSSDVQKGLARLNTRYQEFVFTAYRTWAAFEHPEVKLTCQFLRRLVKPHWDMEKERAVIFVFDGMRYDIWDELARPIFEGQMEILADECGSSLLPTETHISRKAIFSGVFPEGFDARQGEDRLLKESLKRDFGYAGDVEVVSPESSGTGETVRYRAGNLDVYIFELCDKELHGNHLKELPDGRKVPIRPLSFIYQQQIKNILDTEVMSIVRELAPDTKVFVTADHGFGLIGRDRVNVDVAWLNETFDCMYLNARLRQSLKNVSAPSAVRDKVLEFPVTDLRLPVKEDAWDKKNNISWEKQFASVIFPKTDFALARPKANFNPDAYSHGGISLQEMLVPMLAMRVKTADDGLFALGATQGPDKLIEGETAIFRLPVTLATSCRERELRLEIQASYSGKPDNLPPVQVQYITHPGGEIVVSFVPDPNDASGDERRKGAMTRTCRISVVYHAQRGPVRKSQSVEFSVNLNSEKIVRRVPPSLGKLLGMMPKGMK
jgi:hypothetical protein